MLSAVPLENKDPAAMAANLPGAKVDRFDYVDVARALGVIAVVLGHAWYGSSAERVTLSLDLPLFFFLSGFLYSDKYSQHPITLLQKRLQTLYFPFLRWGLFWLALHNLLMLKGLYSAQPQPLGHPQLYYSAQDFVRNAFRIGTFRGTEPFAGALWFLRSLFLTNVIFGLLSFGLVSILGSIREPVRAMVVIALACLGYWSNPVLENRLSFGTSLVALLVFYWGFLYRRYAAKVPMKWYYALGAGAFVIWQRGGIYFGSNEYTNVALIVTLLPAGLYASIYLAKLWERNALLQFIGTNTIFIIGVHFLAFKLVAFVQIRVQSLPAAFLSSFPIIDGARGWWSLYFACGLLIPIGLKIAADSLLAKTSKWMKTKPAPSA